MAEKYTADQLDALKAKGHTLPGTTSYPIDDPGDLDDAVGAVGRGGADHDAIRRYVMKRAREMALDSKIPGNWNADGSLRVEAIDETVPSSRGEFERTFFLEDISIRADGSGRTVVAYAAAFDTPAEIHDQEGHYWETLTRTAFDKTLAERSGQIQVFYNHGKTLYGTPSERFSIPLGVPEEIRPDGKGLLTVTRYNKTLLADEILEAINNGDVKGQSFSGRFITSKRSRAAGKGGIDEVVRSEVAMREYGPTPIPAYKEAHIVGVRHALWLPDMAESLRALSPEEKAELFRLLDTTRHDDESPSQVAEAAREGTSSTAPAPVEGHAGPSPSERRQRVLALANRMEI